MNHLSMSESCDPPARKFEPLRDGKNKNKQTGKLFWRGEDNKTFQTGNFKEQFGSEMYTIHSVRWM